MKLEEFATFLFDLCQDRGNTNNQVIEAISLKLGRFPQGDVESLVRNYRTTGSGLEGVSTKILQAFGEQVVSPAATDDNPPVFVDKTTLWKRPDTDPSTWSDVDRLMAVCEEATGGDDVYVNCLNHDGYIYRYEDDAYCFDVLLYTLDELEEQVVERRCEYVYECCYDIARYGLTGMEDMDLEQMVREAFCDDPFVQLIHNESIAIVHDW